MHLKKIFFIAVILLALLNTVYAGHFPIGTIIMGELESNSTSFPAPHYGREVIFPQKNYLFQVNAKNPSYINKMTEQEIKNLSEFELSMFADLDLISFNKKTGVYKFKLTLNTPGLDYIGKTKGTLMETGGYSVHGSIKMIDNSAAIFFIEGKITIINGRTATISFNKNKYFDIELFTENSILLKTLADFPVLAEVTY